MILAPRHLSTYLVSLTIVVRRLRHDIIVFQLYVVVQLTTCLELLLYLLLLLLIGQVLVLLLLLKLVLLLLLVLEELTGRL